MILKKKIKLYGIKDINQIPQLDNLSSEQKYAMKVVSHILPFRTNNYIIEELIDWNNIPNDPIFQLTFLQKEMLEESLYEKMSKALNADHAPPELNRIISEIRTELNPHPGGQLTANVPIYEGEVVNGIQHKYKETCLIFPAQGQTCHAYCTFCFRWPQFIGNSDLKFTTDESNRFQEYIKSHKELTNVLITGGDPMIMTASRLAKYLLPLLQPGFEHIHTIRIGTKSLGYWPYRFVTDSDSDQVLQLFEKVVKAGKSLAIMAHFNHWIELSTPVVKEAIRRIRNSGATIRSQSPLVKHINDDSAIWTRMWKEQVRLGIIPYYMFMERDTGAHAYFAIPIAKAFEIFRTAYTKVSGLARTVRGPSMSATPGKVVVDGITELNGEKVFVLNFIQGRSPGWVKKPFFAKYSETATWLNQLEPAFGGSKFFYEDELKFMAQRKSRDVKIENDFNYYSKLKR
jgi:KamA family protein